MYLPTAAPFKIIPGAVRNSGRLRVATIDYSKPYLSRIFVDFMQIVFSTALARTPAFAPARQICCCSPLARFPSPLISIHSFLSRHESAYVVIVVSTGVRIIPPEVNRSGFRSVWSALVPFKRRDYPLVSLIIRSNDELVKWQFFIMKITKIIMLACLFNISSFCALSDLHIG